MMLKIREGSVHLFATRPEGKAGLSRLDADHAAWVRGACASAPPRDEESSHR
jgi:hypothetical protein